MTHENYVSTVYDICYAMRDRCVNALHVGDKLLSGRRLVMRRHAQKKRRMNGDEAGASVQHNGTAIGADFAGRPLRWWGFASSLPNA